MKNTFNNNKKPPVCDCIINVQLRKISSVEVEYHTYPKQSRLEEGR